MTPEGGSYLYRDPEGRLERNHTAGKSNATTPLVNSEQNQSCLLSKIDHINELVSGCVFFQVSLINLSGNLSAQEVHDRWKKVTTNSSDVKLILITPERLQGPKSQQCLQELHEQHRLARFVVDEAHLCLQWGDGFRPAYQDLFMVSSRYKGVPLSLLTATITQQQLTDLPARFQIDVRHVSVYVILLSHLKWGLDIPIIFCPFSQFSAIRTERELDIPSYSHTGQQSLQKTDTTPTTAPSETSYRLLSVQRNCGSRFPEVDGTFHT